MSFDPKKPAAQEFFTFDYTWQLATGETISSAVWDVSVVSGTDATPSAMRSGSPVIAAGRVSQKIIDGIAGVKYCLECAATTSAGQVLVLCDTLLVTDACD